MRPSLTRNTHEWVRSIEYTGRPRPMSFSTNADGSTKWVFAGIGGLHGFVVHDFETGEEIFRTEFPSPARDGGIDVARPGGIHPARLQLVNPNHGIGVTPDNTSVWVTDRLYTMVHSYSVPDLEYRGGVPLRGKDPFWITFLPDSRVAYIPHANQACRLRRQYGNAERGGKYPGRRYGEAREYNVASVLEMNVLVQNFFEELRQVVNGQVLGGES